MSARPQQQHPRTRCRLPCTVRKGRRRVRGRVLDVSEGGLCIATSVRFQQKMTVEVVIEDPRHGPIEIEAVVWHERPFRQPSSGRKGFATGFVLARGGADFRALAHPGSREEPAAPDGTAPDGNLAEGKAAETPARPLRSDALELDDGPTLYRVRLKAAGTPRVRTLTLAAPSEAAVREAVLSDLEGEWQILGVEANPID